MPMRAAALVVSSIRSWSLSLRPTAASAKRLTRTSGLIVSTPWRMTSHWYNRGSEAFDPSLEVLLERAGERPLLELLLVGDPDAAEVAREVP
jgi:hypothetical protein